MDFSRIEILLERYWNCVTTIEEEAELRDFFKQSEIPTEFEKSAALFRYFESQRHIELDNKFEEEVLEKISEKKEPRVIKLKHYFNNYMRVAAAVLVVAVASLVFRMEYFDEKPKMLLVEDTFQTPEEAYEETKKAFLLIAEKMNTGRIQAQKIGVLNEAENKIKNDVQ